MGMRLILICSVFALTACTDPRLNANIGLGSNGITVTPSVSGRVGDVGVAVTP